MNIEFSTGFYDNDLKHCGVQGAIISINAVFGVMFMFSVFSMLPVRERENGVKTLQKCSGAPLWLTWLANYCWDFLNAFPSLLIILLIFVSSQSIGGFDTFAENSGKHGRFSGWVLFESFQAVYSCYFFCSPWHNCLSHTVSRLLSRKILKHFNLYFRTPKRGAKLQN